MMKKIRWIGPVLLFAMSTVFALPVGNPADPRLTSQGVFIRGCDECGCSWVDNFSLRLGYEGNFVMNRHLKRKGGTGDLENSELTSNAALIVLNGYRTFDLFATIGSTTASVESQSIHTGGSRFRLAYGPDTSWSLGLRAVLWQWGCLAFGAEGEYFHTSIAIDRYTVAESTTEAGNIHAIYEEGQAALALAYRMVNCLCSLDVIPYLGAKWSWASLDNRQVVLLGSTISSFKSAKDFGWALGVTLVSCDKMSVAAECRFADEKAVAINGQIRF